MDQSGGDVVLIIDEVQQAITTEEGNQMLLALGGSVEQKSRLR